MYFTGAISVTLYVNMSRGVFHGMYVNVFDMLLERHFWSVPSSLPVPSWDGMHASCLEEHALRSCF